MGPKRRRLGIRPQLTMIVLLAAILSTVATLFVTETAIQQYVTQQAQSQEQQHMKIARLVLTTGYGENVSIASDNLMVADSPGTGVTFRQASANNPYPYGKYPLNGDTDYVDQVQQLIGGTVSVYQCRDKSGNLITPCVRISSTLPVRTKSSGGDANVPRAINSPEYSLDSTVSQNMHLDGDPKELTGETTIDGQQYFADYQPIFNPQHQLIGVLYVGVTLSTVTELVANTTIELVIIGTIIMVAGVILALFVASAIVGTLQRAARQVSGASERFGAIAAQQSSGSMQQVWAINAINQALQNLSETATDVSRRTDQLAQMGNQVLQRRSEISPTQIDSIIAYITRSMRDISMASRQQASTYERMTGAMQAVMEVAEQVAGDSQQTTENAGRLETVVQELQQLVGVSARNALAVTAGQAGTPPITSTQLGGAPGAMAGHTVQAVRPQRGGLSGRLDAPRPQMAGVGAMAGLRGERRGARPPSDATMSGAGTLGRANVMASGREGRGRMMSPNEMSANPFGQPPGSSGTRMAGPPYGQPMNGPMPGGPPADTWGMPMSSFNAGANPNPPPWAMPGPNSGPNLPNLDRWNAPGPNSGPEDGRTRPGVNGGFGPGGHDGR
jgi:hypothetical protein